MIALRRKNLFKMELEEFQHEMPVIRVFASLAPLSHVASSKAFRIKRSFLSDFINEGVEEFAERDDVPDALKRWIERCKSRNTTASDGQFRERREDGVKYVEKAHRVLDSGGNENGSQEACYTACKQRQLKSYIFKLSLLFHD